MAKTDGSLQAESTAQADTIRTALEKLLDATPHAGTLDQAEAALELRKLAVKLTRLAERTAKKARP